MARLTTTKAEREKPSPEIPPAKETQMSVMVEADLWGEPGEDESEILQPTAPLRHEPEVAPRKDVVGERVFAAFWRKEMHAQYDLWGQGSEIDRVNPRLRGVLGSFPYELRQMDATLAASMVKWLGTNVGRCFIERALKDASEEAALKAWAVENVGRPGLNFGRTPLDAVLMTEADIAADSGRGLLHAMFREVPDRKSMRSADLANRLALWLGSTQGRGFVKKCLAKTDAALETGRRKQLAASRGLRSRTKAAARAA